MKIAPLGDSALLLDFAGEEMAQTLVRVHAVAAAIHREGIPGVIDVTSAFESVAVFFDLTRLDPTALQQHLAALSASVDVRSVPSGRSVEIPVCCDADFALDLARVAAHTGLVADTIIAQFCETEFIIACIGFMPGFPFLSGLPRELSVPRLETPRTKVPAGSVAIAGEQAGVYPFASPGGWNILGRTPLSLFNVKADPPAPLAPGDRVRFRLIAREEFRI